MEKLKTISALLAVMILLSAFSACSGNDTKNVEPSKESSLDNTSIESSQSSKAEESLISKQESSLVESSNEETDEISEEISKMTLDEKIGQMLMVGIDGTEVDDDFKEFAEEYKFGTVILFGKNITNAEQLVNLTNSIKSTAGDIPYIIGMDEEGGLVTRLPDDVLSMPSALTIADAEDTEYCMRVIR